MIQEAEDNGGTEKGLEFSCIKLPKREGVEVGNDDDFFWLLETETEIPDMKTLANLIRPEIIKRKGSFPLHLESFMEPRSTKTPLLSNLSTTTIQPEALSRSRRQVRRSSFDNISRDTPTINEVSPQEPLNPELLALASSQPSVAMLLTLIKTQQRERQHLMVSQRQQQLLTHDQLAASASTQPFATSQQNLFYQRNVLLNQQLQHPLQFTDNITQQSLLKTAVNQTTTSGSSNLTGLVFHNHQMSRNHDSSNVVMNRLHFFPDRSNRLSFPPTSISESSSYPQRNSLPSCCNDNFYSGFNSSFSRSSLEPSGDSSNQQSRTDEIFNSIQSHLCPSQTELAASPYPVSFSSRSPEMLYNQSTQSTVINSSCQLSELAETAEMMLRNVAMVENSDELSTRLALHPSAPPNPLKELTQKLAAQVINCLLHISSDSTHSSKSQGY